MIAVQGQTILISAVMGRNILGYTSVIVNCKKPNGSIIPLTATVTNTTTGAFNATLLASQLDSEGVWSIYAVVTISGGQIIKTYAEPLTVELEGAL